MNNWATFDPNPLQSAINRQKELEELLRMQQQCPNLMHRIAEKELILKIIKDKNIQLYIELGSGSGQMLKYVRELGIQTTGFEINGIENKNLDLRIRDIFKQETIDEIRNLLKQNETILVYTDGGNKPRELEIVAPMLKKNDFLGAHDFNTEILPHHIPFLDDFKILSEYEPWINTHKNLQRFWQK